MKLEIELDNGAWESLVELSRAYKLDTPAKMAEKILLPTLMTFLRGQVAGVEKMAEIQICSDELAINIGWVPGSAQIYLERTDGGAKIYVKPKS